MLQYPVNPVLQAVFMLIKLCSKTGGVDTDHCGLVIQKTSNLVSHGDGSFIGQERLKTKTTRSSLYSQLHTSQYHMDASLIEKVMEDTHMELFMCKMEVPSILRGSIRVYIAGLFLV